MRWIVWWDNPFDLRWPHAYSVRRRLRQIARPGLHRRCRRTPHQNRRRGVHRPAIGHHPGRHRRGCRGRVRQGPRCAGRLGRPPGGRTDCDHRAVSRSGGQEQRLPDGSPAGRGGQGPLGGAGGIDRPHRQRQLLRAGLGRPAQAAQGAVPAAGHRQDHRRLPAQGCGRGDLAVELPDDADGIGFGAGTDRRERGGAQTGQPDALLRPGLRRTALRSRPAAGSLRHRPRPRIGGGHGDPGELRLPDVHRVDGHRTRPCRAVRPAAHRVLRRTRRQERDDRDPRGEHRQGGEGRHPGVFLQRRTAVHLDRADLRRLRHRRGVHGEVRRGGAEDEARHRVRLLRRHGQPDLRRSAQDGVRPCRGRKSQGRHSDRRR